MVFVTSQAEIDQLCGKAPEHMTKGGCTGHDAWGPIVIMPHPALVSPEMFRLIAAHELAHVNSWPATHGP